MNITNEIIRPEFTKEIEAQITGVQQIEDNIKEVQDFAISLSEYYKDITFTDDQVKQAKDEKANINKFKKRVADFRKEITTKWNEPLQRFVDTVKTTETILTDTYDLINNQIQVYENKTKQDKEEQVKTYFQELCTKHNITFVEYEKAGINVTLSASMKSLKEQAKEYVEKIAGEINLINTQEYPEEIMIEYEKTLDVAKAIQDVKERHERLEKQEEEKQEVPTDQEMKEKIEEVLKAPKEIDDEDEILEMTFKVIGTRKQLKEIKKYMEERGIKYE